ncbi:MAG: flagellar hook-basal body complex protein [bacterium]|nr:flagellar hook-basal body complex protein [bacterium]
MNSSFYSGLSGLSAYAGALNIVGNNLANLNTTGFKSSEVSFEDLVTRTFGGVATNGAGNPLQVGLGTLTNSISGVFSQGSIQTTADSTNVALEGNGFFVVGDTATDRFYTRAGTFFFNDNGDLVNPGGKLVLGYTTFDANNNLVTSGDLAAINLPANSTSAPNESTFMQVFANLDVRTAAAGTYSASTTIFDSKGAPHTITIDFTHTGLNAATNDEWAYSVTIPGADLTAGVAGTPSVLAAGTLEFDGTGTLTLVDGAAIADVVVPITAYSNGANANAVFSWDLVDANGVPLITGYPIPSATTSTNTDGFPPGTLTSVIIDSEGVLQGVYDNGRVEDVAQLAVALFNNPKGLLRDGRNLYSETNASGNAAIGAAATGGRGTVIGSSREASNVDMATEFTQMLVFERGYQANSKIITVSDTVIQTAISLVR